MTRVISQFFIHCSASDNPNHDDIEVIRDWHLQNGWKDVGYHYFIAKDGTLQEGRDEKLKGAGVLGFNDHSIHICLSGRFSFTFAQAMTLHALLYDLKDRYPRATVDPHRMFSPNKTCPNFTDKFLFENGGIDGYEVTRKKR